MSNKPKWDHRAEIAGIHKPDMLSITHAGPVHIHSQTAFSLISLVISIIALVVALSGCTIKGGEVSEEDRGRVVTCKDMRDGEVFSFNTDTVRDIRQGIGAPTTFVVTDNNGNQRTLTSDMEAHYRCTKVPK